MNTIVLAPSGADEHPSQADEALRRAREADRRGGGQQGRPTSLTRTDGESAAIIRGVLNAAWSIWSLWGCNLPVRTVAA